MFWMTASPPFPEDNLKTSHGRVFCEKFHSVYVVRGVMELADKPVVKKTVYNTRQTYNTGVA